MNASDEERLRHMLDYAYEALAFSNGVQREALESNPVLLRALSYDIGVIGEAASKLSPELRLKTPHIPWRAIVGTRNYLFHAYFQVDYDLLWDTVTSKLPVRNRIYLRLLSLPLKAESIHACSGE